MYHTGKNPLSRVTYKSDKVESVKDPETRKRHKAFLRYHDPANWDLLRKALKEMGRAELIGDGPNQLIPAYHPDEKNKIYESHRRKNKGSAHAKRTGKPQLGKGKKILTQHTGIPPKAQDIPNPGKPKAKPKNKRKTAMTRRRG